MVVLWVEAKIWKVAVKSIHRRLLGLSLKRGQLFSWSSSSLDKLTTTTTFWDMPFGVIQQHFLGELCLCILQWRILSLFFAYNTIWMCTVWWRSKRWSNKTINCEERFVKGNHFLNIGVLTTINPFIRIPRCRWIIFLFENYYCFLLCLSSY